MAYTRASGTPAQPSYRTATDHTKSIYRYTKGYTYRWRLARDYDCAAWRARVWGARAWRARVRARALQAGPAAARRPTRRRR